MKPKRSTKARHRLHMSCLAATLVAATLLAACGGSDSSAPGGAATATSALSGRLYGPIGAQVVLRNNGGDERSVTVVATAGNIDPYDITAFSFATPLPDGAAYAVSLQSASANQSCQVFQGASGTLPVAATVLRVGCEHTQDLVSRSADGRTIGTFFDSQSAVVGGAAVAIGATPSAYGEGRFVAFVSSAAIAGSSGRHRQVFLRDRFSSTVYLVSANAAGTEGDADSGSPAISADGLTVAFESTATNLVAGDTNGVKDVFVWAAINSSAGPSRASVGAGGVQYTSGSGRPSVSGDGRVLAFETINSNLGSNIAGSDNTTVVVRRDMVAGSTTLVSRSLTGTAVDAALPSISEDGRRIAFYSFQSNLVAGDNNGLWDIFVADASAGTLQRVSLTNGGGERNQGSESASRLVAPVISGNGRYVAYATTATNVVAGDTNGLQDVFVADTQTGSVVRVSVSSGGAQADADTPGSQGERPALSYDGSWVAFTSSAGNLGVATTTTGIGNVFMHSTVTGETRAVTNNTSVGSVGGPVSISRSGSYVVYGGSVPADPRFTSSGLFARFTGAGRAFYWLTD